jgi:hypothetical protein
MGIEGLFFVGFALLARGHESRLEVKSSRYFCGSNPLPPLLLLPTRKRELESDGKYITFISVE